MCSGSKNSPEIKVLLYTPLNYNRNYIRSRQTSVTVVDYNIFFILYQYNCIM